MLTVPHHKGKHVRYNLLMGMHMDGSNCYHITDQSVNAATFATFLDSVTFPPGTTLLIDNHSIHKSKEVKSTAERKGLTLLFTPPYSPQYNPIEMVFGSIKPRFYKLRYSSEFGDDVSKCVERCVARMSTARCVQGCFRHVAELVREEV
jgi:transposase